MRCETCRDGRVGKVVVDQVGGDLLDAGLLAESYEEGFGHARTPWLRKVN
jgi:hypothetical protein